MLIIPAIDLRDGHCVRLTQGKKHQLKVYGGDAVEVALRYESEGAPMLHLVDLDGAFGEVNSRNLQVLKEIVSQLHIPTQLGGGLRSLEDVGRVLQLGVSRVVLGTMAVESPETLARALRQFGSEHVAVGIDAKDGTVRTRGWEKKETISASDLAQRVAALGVARIIYTDVARDGMLAGVNIEQTCRIALESGLKVTASGGISSLEEIQRLKDRSQCGVDSVIVGKALYELRFTLKEALGVSDFGLRISDF